MINYTKVMHIHIYNSKLDQVNTSTSKFNTIYKHKIIIIIFFFFFFPVAPLSGYGTDPGVSVSPASCLKEVIESATLNPLCYPNSYWAEL